MHREHAVAPTGDRGRNASTWVRVDLSRLAKRDLLEFGRNHLAQIAWMSSLLLRRQH